MALNFVVVVVVIVVDLVLVVVVAGLAPSSSSSCRLSQRRSDSHYTMSDAASKLRRRRRSRPSRVPRMGHQRRQEEEPASDVGAVTHPLTRGRMLERTAAVGLGSGLGLGSGFAFGGRGTRAASADEVEEYASPDGSFALRYPLNFKGFSKPLKTHKVEVRILVGERGDRLGVGCFLRPGAGRVAFDVSLGYVYA